MMLARKAPASSLATSENFRIKNLLDKKLSNFFLERGYQYTPIDGKYNPQALIAGCEDLIEELTIFFTKQKQTYGMLNTYSEEQWFCFFENLFEKVKSDLLRHDRTQVQQIASNL